MARYLIDSHIFLWAIESPEHLSEGERILLSDYSNDLVISVATIWELSIKVAKGRLAIPTVAIPVDHFERAAAKLNVPILPIVAPDAEHVRQLPLIHHDPFDRMLIAQALLGGRTIVTRDAIFRRYPGVEVFVADT